MDVWGIVLISLGGPITLLAAMAFFSKALVSHLLDKDIETFKKSLELRSYEHQIVFSRVHERKVEIISNIYASLKEVLRKAQDFSNIVTFEGEISQDEKRRALGKATKDFDELFEKNKIWLPKDLSDKIEGSFIELIAPAKDFIFSDMIARGDPSHLKDKYQKWVFAHEKYKKEIPEVFAALEKEFRREIGVF